MNFPALVAGPTLRTAVVSQQLKFSETTTLRLVVEGPAPLRVVEPKSWLAGEAQDSWQIRPTGPARLEDIDGGQSRWQLELRLSPYQAGEQVPLALEPLSVTSGSSTTAETLAIPPLQFQVISEVPVGMLEPRGLVGFEPLAVEAPGSPLLFLIAFVVLGLLTILSGVVLRFWKRRSTQTGPSETTFTQTLQAMMEKTADHELPQVLSMLIRQRLEALLQLPAPHRTTAELTPHLANYPQTHATLEELDAIRFAGQSPPTEARARWLQVVNAELEATTRQEPQSCITPVSGKVS
ncbi:MAG: hypothetical protein ACRC8S_21755 [Fimbriiglobus sp.]